MPAWWWLVLKLRTTFLMLGITLLASYLWITSSRLYTPTAYARITNWIQGPPAASQNSTYEAIWLRSSFILQQKQAMPSQQHRISEEEVYQDYRRSLEERGMRYHNIWQWAADAIGSDELFPETPEVDEVLHALETAQIVNVDVLDIGSFESGTTHKWVIMLEGGQKAMMKLVWENKGQGKPNGRCNIGFEMPEAEIAAFHFQRILGIRNTPYVTGRRVNLVRELLPVASPRVSQQIITNSEGKTCVLAKCYLCKQNQTLCPEDGMIETSVAYWVPRHLKLHTYPPRYKPYSLKHMKVWGEVGFNNKSYCKWTQGNFSPYEQLQYYYDLFDYAVLDTVMYHYDAKHYTIDDNTKERGLTIRIDHGRSFCTKDQDDYRIFLAPVTQCCTLRKTTWHLLDSIKDGDLGSRLHAALDKDPIAPGVLQDEWYPVLDRRLRFVKDTMQRCAAVNGWDNVLV